MSGLPRVGFKNAQKCLNEGKMLSLFCEMLCFLLQTKLKHSKIIARQRFLPSDARRNPTKALLWSVEIEYEREFFFGSRLIGTILD